MTNAHQKFILCRFSEHQYVVIVINWLSSTSWVVNQYFGGNNNVLYFKRQYMFVASGI